MTSKIRVVYFKPLFGDDCLWAYAEEDGKYFGIVHRLLGHEQHISASREELEAILKNEEIKTEEGK